MINVVLNMYKIAVLSHGEPRDAAVNFDTCRLLQLHGAVSLQEDGFLAVQMLRLHTVG